MAIMTKKFKKHAIVYKKHNRLKLTPIYVPLHNHTRTMGGSSTSSNTTSNHTTSNNTNLGLDSLYEMTKIHSVTANGTHITSYSPSKQPDEISTGNKTVKNVNKNVADYVDESICPLNISSVNLDYLTDEINIPVLFDIYANIHNIVDIFKDYLDKAVYNNNIDTAGQRLYLMRIDSLDIQYSIEKNFCYPILNTYIGYKCSSYPFIKFGGCAKIPLEDFFPNSQTMYLSFVKFINNLSQAKINEALHMTVLSSVET